MIDSWATSFARGRFYFAPPEITTMSNYVPMTQEAYDRKKTEIERLEREEMPKIDRKSVV